MNKLRAKHRVVIALTAAAVIFALFAPLGAQPAHAECAWGDIICDIQQAVQQLIDQYITPLKASVQLQANKALYSLQYGLARTIAGFMWSISRALTTVGVGVGVLNDWVAVNFFQPMIQLTNSTMKPVVGVFLFLALCVLGLSYLLASLIRLNVVSFRSVIVWWVAGALFFTLGPSLYGSMRQLHRTLSSLFYASSVDAAGTQNPFTSLSDGDPAASNPIYAMTPLCSNFAQLLPGSAGNINGLDVALAFQKADGFDVVNGGVQCLGGGSAIIDIPRQWIAENGFFDAAKAPESWPPMVICPPAPDTCDYDALIQVEVGKMQEAVNQAFSGIARELQAVPPVWFGVVEQLVALCLIVAQGLTFLSFGCAILFAFFRRTEPVAMAVIDQWLALLVQTVVIAVMQGMCLALYLAAARSGSPLVSMSVAVVMLVMMIILLVSGLKAIWSAFNRLFEAFGQASRGVFLTPGQATATVLSAGGAAISGGASVAGAIAGGAQALNSGATWAQAAGVTLGNSKALDGAAIHLARLPGLRDTALGEAASQYVEGVSARQVGHSLVGRLGGASLGAALLTDHNPDHAEAAMDEEGRPYWKRPMLRPSAETALSGLLSGPTWEPGQTSIVGRGGTTLEDTSGNPIRRGDMSVPATFTVNNDGNLDETLDANIKRDLQAERQTAGPEDSGVRGLDQAAQALRASADALRQSGTEGRLNVTGANNVAAVLGRAVDILARDNSKTGQQGTTSERVGAAIAGAAGVSLIELGGVTIPPLAGRLNRFQMYIDQALQRGMSGGDAAQVLREVKASPDGQMLPATRDRLVRWQHEERGEAWADSVQHIQALEHAARLVPAALSAYGTRQVEIPAGTLPGEPIRLPSSGSGGSVTFTPTVSISPTVIVTPSETGSQQASNQPHTEAALDGMRSETGAASAESRADEGDREASV